MRLLRPVKNSLLPLLLAFAAQKASAQLAPADDFFNGGAQLYISNNIPSALEKTEAGLKIYPDDVKLKKLEELLKQQQQSQQQQSQQNQQNQSQQQQQQNQQKSQSQQNQNQKQKDQQSQNQSGQPKDQQPPQANSSGKPDDEKKDGQDAQASGTKEMSPQEAQKLLDAQKGDEQLLQLKPPVKPQDNLKPVKDW
jgi:Ca-activated chloride channel family protein